MSLPQIVAVGRLKENQTGGEIISFCVYLGPLTLVCIVNIPEEGEREAPVYVKFKIETRPPLRDDRPREERREERED